MTININKKYRTRDGREVRIYATDGAQCGTCVHGAVFNNEWWGSVTWNSNGSARSWREDDLDLIEVRPRHKRTVWLNVYPPNVYTCNGATTKSVADNSADYTRIACIKVELDFEEGEGL